jgi:probable phosphoglycerate mutase
VNARTNPHATLELWLVRHGETTANAARQLSGWRNVELTTSGREQARALRQLLDGTPFDHVWSSDLNRAVATARLAWGEPTLDERLREMQFGALEGAVWDELETTVREAIIRFDGFTSPEGESFAELGARLESFIADLAPGRHLVFTHGGVIRTLTHTLGQDRFVPTGSLVAVDWTARKVLFVKEPERTS